MSRFRTLLLATLVVPASSLSAQEVPQAAPSPTSTAAPTPAPSPAPVAPIVLPTPTPTPTPASTPRAVETPPARPTSRPTATSTPGPSPATTATPTPAPRASPTVAPAVLPAPAAPATAALPPVIASPLPTTDDRAADDAPAWPWMLGAGALLAAGIGLWLARRQRTPGDDAVGGVAAAGEPRATPPRPTAVPPVAPVAAAVPTAGLALRFRPTRIGFNMLSATAEGELTIVNEGAESVADIRVRTGLLGAHVEQDADLAAFLAEPVGRPVVPPFALAAGEERTLRVLAAAPRATLRTMTAAGRPMFVPVLAINAVSGATQVAQAFAIGAERVDSAKLAPFWLDVADRSYTAVAARPHGPAVTRRG